MELDHTLEIALGSGQSPELAFAASGVSYCLVGLVQSYQIWAFPTPCCTTSTRIIFAQDGVVGFSCWRRRRYFGFEFLWFTLDHHPFHSILVICRVALEVDKQSEAVRMIVTPHWKENMTVFSQKIFSSRAHPEAARRFSEAQKRIWADLEPRVELCTAKRTLQFCTRQTSAQVFLKAKSYTLEVQKHDTHVALKAKSYTLESTKT